jgi:nucleoside-diphosphate-sugar epimerase
MSKKRILLTGAAGGIGSAFFRSAAATYTFRLADRNTAPFTEIEHQDHEIYPLDIADLDACQQACQGIHTVIHLAADPSPEADFYQSLLHNNIQGTYNIFRAAKDQGCQRVIYASSVQAVLGYPNDVQIHAESALRPMNMYGVSKCFGEAVASYFAHAEGLSSIAIRIGAYDKQGDDNYWLRKAPNAFHLSAYVSERDLNQLLLRCIETPDIHFAIVQGISNNRFKRLDITPARNLLGYAPQDDSFELFQANLTEWLKD